MNYPDGAKHGPARTLYSNHPKLEIARIEHVVFTKADCVLAWRIFSDCERWPRFSDSYGKIEWQGVPWALGSRLQIELVFFFNDTATTEIYTLSLHDALPILMPN